MLKPNFYLFAILLAVLFDFNLSFADDKAIYQQFAPTAKGTGKVYMGREIAHVMGYQDAAWVEREAREKEERLVS